MLSRIRGRINYASVTATLALFVALAGSSFAAPARDAASKLISGTTIKNNSVASADIKNNSIKSGDVRNGSLLRRDFKGGQLLAGPAGPRGLTGPAGGLGQLSHRRTQVNADPNETDFASARCPAGKWATGGSARIEGVGVVTDQPEGDGAGWSASYAIGGGDDADVVVQVVCAPGPLPEGLIP